MLKAFFSYSHRDAELVRSTADRVGRPFAKIDLFEFSAGDELLAAMEGAVQDSDLFVLFASRASLESMWVGAEIEAARYSYIAGRLRRVLVVVTDGSLSAGDLPEWLRRFKFVESRASRPIARQVRSAIDDALRTRQSGAFVGRSRETDLLQEALAPSDGSEPPRAVVLTGLDGIGRQTLARRASRDILSYERVVRIDVESGDSVQDLAVKAAHLFEPINSRLDSERVTTEIQALGELTALVRLRGALEVAAASNELIMLFDKGGLLDNNGAFVEGVRQLIESLPQLAHANLFLITRRRPFRSPSELAATALPVVDVRPMGADDIKRLIGVLARRASAELAGDEITELAEAVRGYPPAAIFAVELIRTYGTAGVLAQQSRIVNFRTSPLIEYMRGAALDDRERWVLRTLAANSPLPLEILGKLANCSREELGEAVFGLVDVSLVIPDDAGWYRVADPVTDAVLRDLPPCTTRDFAAVAEALGEFLGEDNLDGSVIELRRVLFRATVLGGGPLAELKSSAMAADLIQLSQRLYHERAYEQAIAAGRAAVEMRPQNADAQTWLVKSLIKNEEFAEAATEIEQLRRLGLTREAAYNEGFLERVRGRFREAVAAYTRAERLGYSGLALHRELAVCYLQLNDLPAARKHINEAEGKQQDNRYVVDLKIQIACAQKDEDTARELLDTLALVDKPEFVAHRRSRVEDTFGNFEAAYRAARDGTDKTDRPPFALLAQLALCEIKTGRVKEARKSLDRLEKLYPKSRRDVKLGLRCRSEIAAGRYEDALGIWEQFRDKGRPVHLNLRKDALEGLLRDTFVPSERRAALEAEVSSLTRRISDANPIELALVA